MCFPRRREWLNLLAGIADHDLDWNRGQLAASRYRIRHFRCSGILLGMWITWSRFLQDTLGGVF